MLFRSCLQPLQPTSMPQKLTTASNAAAAVPAVPAMPLFDEDSENDTGQPAVLISPIKA